MRSKNDITALGLFAVLSICSLSHAEQTTKLPEPKIIGKTSLEESIFKRRSIRSFKDQSLSMEQISQLLWAGQGITEKTRGLRTAPSAGATYPLELYAVTDKGVFRYIPDDHMIELISNKDQRTKLSLASKGQPWVAKAPLSIVITAVPERIKKYGDHATRYTDMEAGHAAQNILLQSVALGLAGVPIGAFLEMPVRLILNIPDGQVPLYILSIGHRDKT